ncbi:hypothetical protein AAFF_G00202760 [Aldrovandia affinis]|uniref:Consortin N-terminal domain-containing protein n=1 Tax=Aldrovandia affinis TaxID=143900 RepID=A0AAD7WVA5_9TELE|nr:hypothetical protein AAFF_G00202760 [Aldrovandia affinis]
METISGVHTITASTAADDTTQAGELTVTDTKADEPTQAGVLTVTITKADDPTQAGELTATDPKVGDPAQAGELTVTSTTTGPAADDPTQAGKLTVINVTASTVVDGPTRNAFRGQNVTSILNPARGGVAVGVVGGAELHGHPLRSLMEQGGSLRGGAEMRGQGRGSELLSNMERAGSPLSPPGSDQNQNRLPRGEEEEEEWEALEDSENNNQVEEMDNNNRGRPEPKTVPGETGNCPESRPLQNTGGDPSSSPSVCPPSAGDPPGPSPSLLASLQELGEHRDHTLLPQSLHQIAEAYFLDGDYEWAVHFIHLERLYHERLLSNLAALQDQWESRWKASSQQEASSPGRTHADREEGNLDALRLVCRTHHRFSLSVEKCVAGDIGFKNSLVSGQLDRGDKLGATLVSRSTDSITEPLGSTAEPAAMGDAADVGVEQSSPEAGRQEDTLSLPTPPPRPRLRPPWT